MQKKLKLTDLKLFTKSIELDLLPNVTTNSTKKTRSKSVKIDKDASFRSTILSVNERNHARLQYQKIEELIAKSGYSRQHELHPYFYLSELLQRNAFVVFDKDMKKYSKNLLKNEELIGQILLMDLVVERIISVGSFDKNSARQIHTTLLTQINKVKMLQQNFEWRFKSYEILLKRFDPSLIKKTIEKPTTITGLWQKIYALRIEINESAKIDQKINSLLKLYALTKNKNSTAFKREHGSTCGNLATYFMISGQFEKAITYYEQAVKFRHYFRPANYFTLQYNFVGLCLRNNQFELAYKSMLKVDSAIQKLPALAFKWQLLKSMCYVLYGNVKEIKKILPSVPDKKNKQDYIYYYIIWAIYFTKENKTDTALQMIETARSLSNRHKGEASLNIFINTLKKFHLLSDYYNQKSSAKKTLESLKIVNWAELSSGNILPLVWLKTHLKNLA